MTRGRRSTLTRLLILVLLLLVVVAMILGTSTLRRFRYHYRSAQWALGHLEGTLSGGATAAIEVVRDPAQMAALQNTLDTLDSDLAAIESLSQPFLPLTTLLGWLPAIGGDVQAAPHLLAVARHTVDAAQSLSEGFAPLLEQAVEAEAGFDTLAPELVRALVDARPQMEAAQDSLALAAAARGEVDPGQLSARSAALLGRFDRYLPPLEDALTILSIVPQLLGADGERSYLLVAQNNQELRPTGGFISGAGLLQLESGKITDLSFSDSYTVDDLAQPHPPAPAPLRRLMKAGMLLLRDANWWPDFPTSARAIADLYRQDQGQRVDAVVAVDLSMLNLLLQATGPIDVPGYEKQVTSANLQEMMMSYWQAPRTSAPGKEGTDWWLHRKDFAADLLSALLPHLMQQATLEDLTTLAQSTGKALDERHLLIYSQVPETQSILNAMGWDGALRPYSGDYLMVVDSNVGFNKVNPNIEQTIDYQVEWKGEGGITATLTLGYRHLVQKPMPACIHESRYGDSYQDLLERCYWDYLRVYVPEGSEVLQVLGADGDVEVYEEAGRTVVATSFLLETGQARQIQLTYRPNLPSATSPYGLLVQKQPGTDAVPLRVHVVLPGDVRPTAISPLGWNWLDGSAVWQGLLNRDREFEISWD